MKQVVFIVSFWFIIASCSSVTRINKRTLKQIPQVMLGSFKDDYGSTYTISNKDWKQGEKTKYQFLLYNSREHYIIAKNDSGNSVDGGLYTRIDIVYFTNMEPWQWGYCYSAYNSKTIQEAINTAVVDKVNPRKGCNGYPFSRMKKNY